MKNLLGKRVLVEKKVFKQLSKNTEDINADWVEGSIISTQESSSSNIDGHVYYCFLISTQYGIVNTSFLHIRLKKPWYAFWRKW